MGFKLRDYQQELVDEARQHFANGAQGVLVQSAAGSGKSVVIAEIAKLTANNGGHVLFVVHRNELRIQIKETFKQHGVDMDHVTINTVIKARNRLGLFPEPNLIITDETHHSRAKTYREIYDYFPNAYRLGFTATVWRMSGKGFTEIYDEMVEGKSVQWLIDNENLAPYDYYSLELADMDKLKKSSTGDYTYKSMDEAVSRAIYGDAVDHYKRLADGEQAILYAHNVEASQGLAEVFREHGISAVHADAKTPQKERDKIMQDFREGRTKVLCNVDLISEGFDVPDCSVVILMRPTASLVLHIQQSMRGMRYQPGKKATIIDHVGNVHRHGLPTTEHEWTLKDRPKKGGGEQREDTIPVKECLNCYGTVHSRVMTCPICGHEFPPDDNEIEQVDAKLEKINELNFTVEYEKMRWRRKSVSELQTIEDYVRYADAMDYKVSWVKFQHPELKNVSWPQFYQRVNQIKI